MAPCRSQFHQPVFAVPGVQREGLPYEDGGRYRTEADTYPLADADHVEDDEYGKFSSGDPDTSKTAASWFGACIFLIVAATILRSFFL